MQGQIPYAGMTLSGNATGQALTAAAGATKLTTPWGSTATEFPGTGGSGDNSVKTDKANARFLLQQSDTKQTYKVTMTATLKSSAAATVTLNFRKNGAVLAQVQNCVTDQLITNVPQRVSLVALVEILPGDNPGTIAVSGDPAANSFAGGAAQLKTMVPLELYGLVSADSTILISEQTTIVERIG